MRGTQIETEQRLIACLRNGEKSLAEVFRASGLSYSTVQKFLAKLVREGAAERHWDDSPNPKYLYRLKD